MKKVRFGIIGTGGIAEKFAVSAAYVPEAEMVGAASRSLEKAQQFAQKFVIPKAYGSYEALLRDDEIDAVYIATPHSHHKENCLAAIAHGKHILCEKPLVLTKANAEQVFAAAAEKGLFIMEAMWTRFIPTFVKAKEWVNAGRIGDIRLIQASLGFHAPEDPNSRLLSKDLAGGALYDLGVYLFELTQEFTRGKRLAEVQSFSIPAATGVDGSDSIVFRHEDGTIAQLFCSLLCDVENTAILYGEKGYIKLLPDFHHPRRAELYQNYRLVETFEPEYHLGYEFEIRHAARCIAEGRLISDIIPPGDTIECEAMFEDLLFRWGYT
ncbi:Gfo/Idh/MocA family protein [Acetanaerobacterium elongatum]|uniref:Predicted dehydrogenase n=1 Tax=Acetanaerobacterium elongatum TaxID=258515 RepID=A0A1H0D979_9FIRM|nr:Gfo/Idh/MocA family oxidoreductase [Acetanaerobacterium elongatum]SDN66531.1 Predicted dehydrogenase [Acetanaerobacterium elongatum]